jgi:hypothetical protein
MPVQSCNQNGRPGYKYGESGACYTYSPGDESGRKKAKQKAFIQGAAIAARTGEKMEKEDASAFEDFLDEAATLEKARYDKFVDDGEGLIVEYPDDVEKFNPNHSASNGQFSIGSSSDTGKNPAHSTPIGHEKCGPDAKNSQGQTISSVRATAGNSKGPCHQYVVGDRASEDAAISATEADSKKLVGGVHKGLDVQDIHLPGTKWHGKKMSELSEVELKECKKAMKRAGGCPKVTKSVPIMKMDEEQRLIYGVVLVPDVEDLQGDICSKEDIQEACHDYLVNSRLIKAQHRAPTDADVVECYIAPTDIQLGKGIVPEGSWVMVTKIHSNAMWEAVKKGDITGYSIGGRGTREAI